MKPEEFDKIFKQKLESIEPAFREEAWLSLAQRLPQAPAANMPAPNQNLLWWWGGAVVIVLLLSHMAGWMYWNNRLNALEQCLATHARDTVHIFRRDTVWISPSKQRANAVRKPELTYSYPPTEGTDDALARQKTSLTERNSRLQPNFEPTAKPFARNSRTLSNQSPVNQVIANQPLANYSYSLLGRESNTRSDKQSDNLAALPSLVSVAVLPLADMPAFSAVDSNLHMTYASAWLPQKRKKLTFSDIKPQWAAEAGFGLGFASGAGADFDVTLHMPTLGIQAVWNRWAVYARAQHAVSEYDMQNPSAARLENLPGYVPSPDLPDEVEVYTRQFFFPLGVRYGGYLLPRLQWYAEGGIVPRLQYAQTFEYAFKKNKDKNAEYNIGLNKRDLGFWSIGAGVSWHFTRRTALNLQAEHWQSINPSGLERQPMNLRALQIGLQIGLGK